jgi:CNT family concentrative nucleoside transporter
MADGRLSDRQVRLAAAGAALVIGAGVLLFDHALAPAVRGGLGIICFVTIIFACSSAPRAVNWRTVAWGMALQLGFALFILKFRIGDWRPGYALFAQVAGAVEQFLRFTRTGAEFVFGGLANQEVMSKVFPGGFVFAFMGLPVIIFVAACFSVLYHLGVLQFVVRVVARLMMRLMQTSGAETLAGVAEVFLGHTEAPLIVRPYVVRMTQSELLAIMTCGLATISGGMMAVYIAIGADPVAILTTSVMAAPCGLYLAKILLPETDEPETRGSAVTAVDRPHANVVDAFAAGASDGTTLAINVGAMLIAFLALLALVDHLLGLVHPALSLAAIFARILAPAALLIGVPVADVPAVADLLGTKLVANEFVAYIKLTTQYRATMSPEAFSLATYALTGFANVGSIGILLGGLGGMAPSRRGDLARLSGRALFAGFLATMINASMASMLL